jgi:TPR repeat protein
MNHGGCSHEMARCYEEGIGVAVNLSRAKAGYRKAAKQGSAAAQLRLDMLLKAEGASNPGME